MRRGGFLLTADVSEEHVDEAVRVLDDANSVDLDDRSSEWRSSGWDYAAPAAATGLGLGAVGTDRSGHGKDVEGEQSIPIIEEELVVGKREVDRGDARVRSYVTRFRYTSRSVFVTRRSASSGVLSIGR